MSDHDHHTLFSSNHKGFSLSPNLDITIDEGSPNSVRLLEVEDEGNRLENDCDQLFKIDGCEHENGRDETIVVDSQSGDSQGKDYPPPVVGMEFDTYNDAYNYYNSYAREIGFAIRVKSSWTKRNSKEKRGAVLCCNCEGFKTVKEANSHRKETRRGCLAKVRLRLVESNKWRVDGVKLEHNHSFDPERAQNSKSHKRMDSGAKRKIEPTLDVEVRTIKLYRMPIADASGYGSSNSNEGGTSTSIDFSRRLKLKKGDAELISSYFCHHQLMNPNFFYVMDLNDDGQLRNIFWIDSRSRAAYNYFGDVVAFDSTYLSNNYEIPLIAFVGVNHHGQSVLLGCGLLADETFETYIWLFRAWLTCMSGRPPQTILTNQCKAMQNAIAEVFPRAHHRICLSQVMQSILGCLVQFEECEAFQMALTKVIYDPNTVDEFERDWDELTQHFGIRNHENLQSLHEEREHWAPVYSKDTFFAGISDYEKGESVVPFFKGHVHHQTSLKEFFEIYELVQQKKCKTEVLDDLESHNSSPLLKTRCYYELQLSKLYTNAIFRKFQDEVVMMSSCFSISQIQPNGSIVTFLVKERQGEEPGRDNRHFEVMYDKTVPEVRCMCSCFNFKGYLCRHALYILNYNGVEEIPCQYILSRWRKDFKRLYVPHLSSDNVDITNPVQCFDHLYKRAMQVVEEGMLSQNHYTVSLQAFKDSLNKIRLGADRSPPNVESFPSVKNILLLDSDGKRVAVKYFSDYWPTNDAKEIFEKTLVTKTQKTTAHTEAEIAMFENNIVVYKFVQDLFFFVTGVDDKNELILTTVLQAFFDSVGLLLRGNVEKKEALESLDLILLCIDKIVDGGGIILETDPNVIARKVASNSIDSGALLFEQTPCQALATAGQHLARSLLK